MQYKIAGIRLVDKPSKAGGTWKLAQVKIEGRGETIFELQGYGSKYAEKIKQGDTIVGYEGSRTWNDRVTPTINRIDAEYIYDLLVQKGILGGETAPAPTPSNDSGWEQPAPPAETSGGDDW